MYKKKLALKHRKTFKIRYSMSSGLVTKSAIIYTMSFGYVISKFYNIIIVLYSIALVIHCYRELITALIKNKLVA